MRILVTGRDGQLGAELVQSLGPIGTVTAVGKRELNLADLQRLDLTLQDVRPDVVVNAAAYTNVEKAESEFALATAVNAEAPELMARYAARHSAVLVHFSTDYVFDGLAGRPYVESDLARPLMAYGRTKLDGERRIKRTGAACLVFRTSWLYSYQCTNFVTKMVELFQRRDEVTVVDDQRGTPTYAPHLAHAVTGLLARFLHDGLRGLRSARASGLFHLAGQGEATWFDVASETLSLLRASSIGHRLQLRELRRIRSVDYPSAVQRPPDSRLDCSAAARQLGSVLPSWREGLRDCVQRIAAHH
jgi:dTDP-4-dehydrorhamnose reductase